MRYWAVCSIVAVLGVAATAQGRASQPVDANAPRVATLVLQPARLDAGSKKYFLLPSAAELKDGDAAALYKKAIEVLPRNLNDSQLQGWMKLPPDKLPQDKVPALLQQAQASLQLVAQGAACKSCDWTKQADLSADLTTVRQIAILLRLKARLEIAQKRYDDAIGTIRTTLTMSKHVGDNSTLIPGLVGVAVAAAALQEIENLAQAPNTPNLLAALKALPQPLIDMEEAIVSESQGPTDEGAQRSRQIMQRLRGTVAGLECIEALRHHAATHNNKLPAKLSDISDVQLPNDPATAKPFAYHLEGSKAILEVSAPKGGRPRDSVRYEITIAR